MNTAGKKFERPQIDTYFNHVRIAIPSGVSVKFRPLKDLDVSFFEVKSPKYIDDRDYDTFIQSIKTMFDFMEIYHETDRTDFRVFVKDIGHETFKMYSAWSVMANGIMYKPSGCLVESQHLLSGCGKCGRGNHIDCAI